MAKIIALANQKGGVGKTTSAINLGAALGESGQRTLLIDFDPQGNSSSGLVSMISRDHKTIYDLLCGNANASECIVHEAADGLDLVPADINLSGAEVELLEMEDAQVMLRDVIKPFKKMYDYILIDCPPSIGSLTVNALTASDSVIIPVQCEYFALEGLNQVLNTINIVKQRLNRKLQIEGILFTMFDTRTNLSQEVVLSVRETLDEHIFETVIPRNIKLAEAPSHGVPITVYDSGSRGAESYRLLAAEIISR